MVQVRLPKPKFTVRTLLLSIVLLALMSAYFGLPIAIYRRESRIVRQLEVLGASCSRRVDYSNMTPGLRSASWWGDTRLFERVVHVDLSNTVDISHGEVQLLSGLRALRSVNLAGTETSDKAVALLGELPNLYSVNLSGTRVTDASGESLMRLKHLHHLDISKTAVTDKVLEHIGRLENLHSLLTGNTSVNLKSISDRFSVELVRNAVMDRFPEMGICGHGGSFPNHHVFWLDSDEKTQLMFDALDALGDDSHFAFSVGLTAQLGTDKMIHDLAASPTVVALQVESNKLTDDGISRLKSATQLRYLGVYGSTVTPKCASELAAMSSLAKIVLPLSAASSAAKQESSTRFLFTNAKAPDRTEFTKDVFWNAHHLWQTSNAQR